MVIYFVTGNKNKLKQVEKHLAIPIKHLDLELDEIQELDPAKIAEHKVKQGWEQVKKPVFILDNSFSLDALNGFPGPLVKWFLQAVGLAKICQIVDSLGNRQVTVKNTLTFFDGKEVKFFQAAAKGTVSNIPRGSGGFGWNPIFIPSGSNKTYSELAETDPNYNKVYQQVIAEFGRFLKKEYSK